MRVLSRYSKSRNITNVEDVSQQEYLEALSKTQKDQLQSPDDYYNPYNFEQWYTRSYGIISGQEKQQYQNYLRDWHTSRYTPIAVQKDIRSDYIGLLNQLTLVLDKQDHSHVLNNINWDDILEVERVIPYYVTKLKEIALYLINKRDALKKTKIKYNMTGANQALEKLFYEYLLKAFTHRDYVMNVPDQPAFSTFPDLSSVKDGFQIQIQELYDNQDYFDKDPTLSASNYFDTSNPDVTAFYESLNINPSAYEWLFKTGFSQLCADNPLLWILGDVVQSEIPLSSLQAPDSDLLIDYLKFQLTEKYIGTNQYYVSNGYYTLWKRTIDYPLIGGNNWFFWPSGEFVQDQPTYTIDPIPLTATALIEAGATGFKNYLSADKIFIKYDKTVSGAWLKKVVTENTTVSMSARLESEDVNMFKFPFPGYGIAGEDIAWSGPHLSNLDLEINYLPVETQDTIKHDYWSDTTTVSAICAIALYDSNLVDSGAFAAKHYNEADKIRVRPKNIDYVHDSNPNEVYHDQIQHAWLYKVEKTDIPIVRGQNHIHWPLYRYNTTDTTLKNVLTSECAPISLSSIPMSAFVGARAGYELFDSDIIYKLDGRSGTPIECAFLSGTPIKDITSTTFTDNATGAEQLALSLKCKAGEYVTFLWTGSSTNIEDVNFQHFEHQSDCPYLFLDHHSLYKENPSDQNPNIDYKQWQKCECRAISFSPLGHPGAVYNEYKQMTDIVFLDTLNPLPFSVNTWIGMDGNGYLDSEDFAWFQLSGSRVEPDVGWGNGSWVAGGIPSPSRTFTFKKGYQYKYLRAGLGHDTTYLVDNTVPYLIIKHPYTDITLPRWIMAIPDEKGNWQIDYTPTDMVLNAGDYLLYDHMDSNWYCITGIGDFGTSISYQTTAINDRESRWQNHTVVTSGQTVRLLWPDTMYANGPSTLSFELTAVLWQITPPSQVQITYSRSPREEMEIYTDRLGLWQVTAIGHKIVGGSATETNVGNFTVSSLIPVPTISGSTTVETIYADTINMSINSPIYGWNYATKSYDGVSVGARPFWAYASDQSDRTTKYKGIDVWGGGIMFVDDYVPITQPPFSEIVFNTNNYIEYEANSEFVWYEPLTLMTATTANNWCNLIIDPSKLSPLNDFLYNINEELVVSATDERSTLILEPYINGHPVLVNYWATNPFIWTEVLTNSSLGLPPTGGVFVPFLTGLLVDAVYPYANLTNRHYPTIATVPHLGELYNTEDSGGYFTPKMLGISTFLSKQNENHIGNTRLLTDKDRGLSGVFQDIDTFITDAGLSQTDQITPITQFSVDASWMKGSPTEGYKAGFVVDTLKHQEFIPYQTKFESRGTNNLGITRQNDSYDPWIGNEDNTWNHQTEWPPSFTKQYNIDGWYSQFTNTKQLWQWKCDIFGNEYGLFKVLSAGQTMYDKKHQIGDLWVRSASNKVQPASAGLSAFFFDFSGLTETPLLSTEIYSIKNIDLFYDTLMVQTPNWILFNKIEFNYNTGLIDFNVNNIHYINLKQTGHDDKFAGVWLFDEDKIATISVLVSTASGIYPQLRDLDLDSNDMRFIYNQSSIESDQLSAIGLTAIEDPVFTYNKDTQTYNMAFICRSNTYTSFLIGNIFIADNGDEHNISSINVITPSI